MGQGFWILIWDGWDVGLDMINPRFIEGGRCFSTGGDRWSDEKIAKHHRLHMYEHWRVIRSEAYLPDVPLQYLAEHLAQRIASELPAEVSE